MYPLFSVFFHLLVLRNNIKKNILINNISEELEGGDDRHPIQSPPHDKLLNKLDSYYSKQALLRSLREPNTENHCKISELDTYYKEHFETDMVANVTAGGLFSDWYQYFFVNIA